MLRLPYKKLLIWQKGIVLTRLVYRITRKFPKDEIFDLTSQMRRSALSVPCNIAEGSQRSTNKEFAHFITIAIGSIAELETQRIIAFEENYIPQKDNSDLENQIDELKRMLFSFYEKITKHPH